MSNHINIGRLSDFVARSPLRLGRSVKQFGCSTPVSNSSFVVLMVGRATALLHHPPLLSHTLLIILPPFVVASGRAAKSLTNIDGVTLNHNFATASPTHACEGQVA